NVAPSRATQGTAVNIPVLDRTINVLADTDGICQEFECRSPSPVRSTQRQLNSNRTSRGRGGRGLPDNQEKSIQSKEWKRPITTSVSARAAPPSRRPRARPQGLGRSPGGDPWQAGARGIGWGLRPCW